MIKTMYLTSNTEIKYMTTVQGYKKQDGHIKDAQKVSEFHLKCKDVKFPCLSAEQQVVHNIRTDFELLIVVNALKKIAHDRLMKCLFLFSL